MHMARFLESDHNTDAENPDGGSSRHGQLLTPCTPISRGQPSPAASKPHTPHTPNSRGQPSPAASKPWGVTNTPHTPNRRGRAAQDHDDDDEMPPLEELCLSPQMPALEGPMNGHHDDMPPIEPITPTRGINNPPRGAMGQSKMQEGIRLFISNFPYGTDMVSASGLAVIVGLLSCWWSWSCTLNSISNASIFNLTL